MTILCSRLATISALAALGVAAATGVFAQEKPVAGAIAEGSLKGKTLTFASFGGIFQDGQIAALKEFVDKSGVKLLSDGPTEIAKVQAQVEFKNVTWTSSIPPTSRLTCIAERCSRNSTSARSIRRRSRRARSANAPCRP